jgi:DNA-binding response OmpR family regulator
MADPLLAAHEEPEEGFAGVVICAVEGLAGAISACQSLREQDNAFGPVLLVISPSQLAEVDFREEVFDDFVVSGAPSYELEARLNRVFWKAGRSKAADLIVYGPLALNLETYQAAIEGHPLDLTYMEYELLRFLASHPGRVFTREALLSKVWGYEYFGGARTVDVHIRRLRAKLGEEHAHLIDTVRSVGYRFGSVRWLPRGPKRQHR